MKKRLIYLFVSIILPLVCFAANSTEVRAVWLATNWGLDWPQNTKGVEAQKQKLCSILDNLKAANFNVVLFQARAQGCTFYRSKIEPLSPYFCHDDDFDPLKFAIKECHKRGMECHAWIMTYSMDKAKYKIKNKNHKQYILDKPSYYKLVNGIWYLDPGRPETINRISDITMEIVKNYDVDGIHFDHIRYPRNDGKFPDKDTYRKYGDSCSIENWRRNNINKLVFKLYDEIKANKPWVQVSSAPIGKYKALSVNDGWTAFETVYQDAGYWLKSGKQDIIFPMEYFKEQAFSPYTKSWLQNANNRYVVPGLGAYKMDQKEENWNVSEITKEVHDIRKSSIMGEAFFRASEITDNLKHLKDSIYSYYKYPAKLPPLKWLSQNKPETPQNLQVYKTADGILHIKWQAPEKNPNLTYNIYVSHTDRVDTSNDKNLMAIGIRKNDFSFRCSKGNFGFYYTVTASDRFHNESNPCISAYFSHAEIIE